MSQKIKAPNEKSNGFLWGIVAIVVIAVVVIALVVIQGRDDKAGSLEPVAADVNFNVSVEDGSIVLVSDDVAADAPVAELFEDYSCHYCSDLVIADHESLQTAIGDGKITMRFNTVNFLDGGDDGHSTLAGVVAMAIADSGNASAFWGFHNWAFINRTEISGYSLDQFADAAETLGVDADTVDAIRDGSVRDEYQALLEANMDELTNREGDSAGTPTLYVDDTKFDLQQDPEMDTETQMADWVPEVVG
ncbi:DsbA family protein [Corynebacterium terpenotabidum]|uniref:Thioredoxin-like fold domain-containing protein n=1 Tax=Corynebacterium terpenotabidum Y-11 TaxID=1200352 RepID=S4XI21_9CORY|nr:thioredoxin domain-containing protein [Corynebacterium terpenotabidum]AGP30268.1 hypothetical protein A606_03075 [Corynebacterium terpenotabidum Y-11]